MRILRGRFLSYDHAKDRFLDGCYGWLCWWLKIDWEKKNHSDGMDGIILGRSRDIKPLNISNIALMADDFNLFYCLI